MCIRDSGNASQRWIHEFLKHRNIQSLTRIAAVQDRIGLFLLCKYGINPNFAVNTTKKGCDYMFPSEKEYGEMTKRLSPPSSKLKDFIWAYACLLYTS